MRVEEDFAPVLAVGGVGLLGVDSHECREELRDEEDHEAGCEVGCWHAGGGGVEGHCGALLIWDCRFVRMGSSEECSRRGRVGN